MICGRHSSFCTNSLRNSNLNTCGTNMCNTTDNIANVGPSICRRKSSILHAQGDVSTLPTLENKVEDSVSSVPLISPMASSSLSIEGKSPTHNSPLKPRNNNIMYLEEEPSGLCPSNDNSHAQRQSAFDLETPKTLKSRRGQACQTPDSALCSDGTNSILNEVVATLANGIHVVSCCDHNTSCYFFHVSLFLNKC